jgi:hypothetical protein
MKTLKAGQPLVDFIKLCYRAGRPPLLVGGHGIGKSEILAQAAEELDIGYLCRDLSLMEPPDLVGLPRLADDVTRFYAPAFLPRDGAGLLVFEELNRCQSYMRAPCLQLLTARTLNDYRLPDGWLPAAAINPSDEDYDVSDLDPALLSRFVVVGVEADPRQWLAWAEGRGLHQDVLDYVGSDPRLFGDTNPRAWAGVSDLLRAAGEGGLGPEALEALDAAVAGLVGDGRAVAFRDFRKHGGGTALPGADELLGNYARHRGRVRAWVSQGRTDTLDALAHGVKVLLQPLAGYERVRQTPPLWKALGDFLADLPADLADRVREFLRERDYDIPPLRGRRKP